MGVNWFATPAVAVLSLFAAGHGSSAQTFELVSSLPDSGNSPSELVATNPFSLLGTASFGGNMDSGTLFKVSQQGVVSRLYSFGGNSGVNPSSPLTRHTDSDYYGVTKRGGAGGNGVAYRYFFSGPFAGTTQKLDDFSSITALNPVGRLISSGTLYGQCVQLSDNPSLPGLLYYLRPAKGLFTEATFPANGSKGVSPQSLASIDGEHFYGTAKFGGSDNQGVLFQTSGAGKITKLLDFTGPNGRFPGEVVKGSDGNFYGTTSAGGTDLSDGGTIFRVTPAGEFSTLASFTPDIGSAPIGRLVEFLGTFYGITEQTFSSYGTIFKITPSDPAPAITKLAELDYALAGGPANAGLALGVDGMQSALYGVTSEGGAHREGIVFKVSFNGNVSKLADLGAPLGMDFHSGLTLGPDGNFYGTTQKGAHSEGGVIVRVTPGGEIEEVPDTGGVAIGSEIVSRLILASDDKLYGTSDSDGLFNLSTNGNSTLLANVASIEQQSPNGVIEASDGAFYGSSVHDFENEDRGGLFRYSSAAGLEKFHEFAGNEGKEPIGQLLEGPDGALYGVTRLGGAFNKGTVFRITKQREFKTLASFNGGNGAYPAGALVLGPDGRFYGLTTEGGPAGAGTVFRISRTGQLSIVSAFTGANGSAPKGSLLVGPGGKLYGTTSAGGSFGYGTIFATSTKGGISVIESLDGNTTGAHPESTLCIGPDQNLYGTTYSTVFRLLTANAAPIATDDSLELPIVRTNVLTNDTDPNKDPLTIVSVTDGQHGTVTFTPEGTVSYHPAPGFDPVEGDTFTYTIRDVLGATSTATVSVSVPSDLLRATAGNFSGFLNSNGAVQGYLTLTSSRRGAFTGIVHVDGRKVAIKGKFDESGHFSATFGTVTVTLQFDPVLHLIAGMVTTDTGSYAVNAPRQFSVYSDASPTLRNGRYTLLLAPEESSPTIPGGVAYATMKVSPAGAIAIVGKLGDGVPFSTGASLTEQEDFSLFVRTYIKGRGYLAGRVTFAESTQSDCSGTLSWKKPAQPGDTLYPDGFATTVTLNAARYYQLSPALPVQPESPNATLTLEGVVTKDLFLQPNNVISALDPGTDKTQITLDSVTGLLSGSYKDGATRRALGGVIFQKGAHRGEGLFIGNGSTGTLSILPIQ